MAAVLVGGCVSEGGIPAPSTTIGSPTVAPSADDHQCFHASLSREDVGLYTVAAMVGRGMGFVSGQVNATEPGMYNTLDGKKPRGMGAAHPGTDAQSFPMIYTPIDVLVDRTLNGDFKPGSNRFLVEGGSVGCVSMTVDDAPTITKGTQYVLVLEPARDANGSHLGNLWRVVKAWTLTTDGTVDTIEGPMSLDALASKITQSR